MYICIHVWYIYIYVYIYMCACVCVLACVYVRLCGDVLLTFLSLSTHPTDTPQIQKSASTSSLDKTSYKRTSDTIDPCVFELLAKTPTKERAGNIDSSQSVGLKYFKVPSMLVVAFFAEVYSPMQAS